MLNKKGYVLVYALGLIMMMLLLIASLTNTTMQRSYWVNQNVKRITDINEAKGKVNAAATELATYFNNYINSEHRYLYELDSEFQLVFDDFEYRYDVIIRDLTKESCEYPNNPDKPVCHPVRLESYTYAYEIVYDTGEVTAQKKFFLSMIPSFLYFGLGSKSDITVNGGAYIEGDIYVEDHLYLSNMFNYLYDGNLRDHPSSFISVDDTNSIYLQNDLINSCRQNDISPCYTKDEINQLFVRNTENFYPITSEFEYTSTFLGTPPRVKKYTDRFLNVDFDASYVYYLNDAINQKREIDLTTINTELDNFVSEGLLYEASTVSNLYDQNTLSVIYRAPKTYFSEGLSFDKNRWIIVNGDLEISNYGINYITIDANILVTGKIIIAGNVAFNSTIYSLSEGLIHNASIKGINQNQLVLLTKEDIQFSKINQFDNNFSSRFSVDLNTGETIITPDIKGFFYTETNASIYTVASNISIEGGVFTNDINNQGLDTPIDFIENTDSIGLLINSHRGSVEDGLTDFIFHPTNDYKQSRLIIKHNIDIIKNQPKGLPLNSQLNFLFEDTVVK